MADKQALGTKFIFTRITPEEEAKMVAQGRDPKLLEVTIKLEVDVTDRAAMLKLAGVLKEIIPANEIMGFLDQFKSAAVIG